MKYDIFISYRRDGGVLLASLLSTKLRDKGYSVFFDLEAMKLGKEFNIQLYERIEQCKVFLLVLPPNALDRCVNEGDWVRNEISKALKLNKPIIPIMMPGFDFPDNLPKDIEKVSKYHGLTASDELFDMQVEKLCGEIDGYIIDKKDDNSVKPIASVDMRNVRTFASCGKESSVFKIKKSSVGDEITIFINFEKTRLRDEIPDFAGVYYIFVPSMDISNCNNVKLEISSPDNSVETVWVELKPKGKVWMHEVFDFELSSEYNTYTIDVEDFVYKDTLKCLEEITLVFKPESFAHEQSLKGTVCVRSIKIE